MYKTKDYDNGKQATVLKKEPDIAVCLICACFQMDTEGIKIRRS